MKTLVMASAMFIVSATALLGAELHLLAVGMSGARVATGQQAQARLYEHLVQAEDDGPSAMESARAIARFKIGFDVPDFGRTGDRIWLVHVVAIDDATVKRVAWINAESGAVIFLLEDRGESAARELQLRCAMARTEFVVGEMLPVLSNNPIRGFRAISFLAELVLSCRSWVPFRPSSSRLGVSLAPSANSPGTRFGSGGR